MKVDNQGRCHIKKLLTDMAGINLPCQIIVGFEETQNHVDLLILNNNQDITEYNVLDRVNMDERGRFFTKSFMRIFGLDEDSNYVPFIRNTIIHIRFKY